MKNNSTLYEEIEKVVRGANYGNDWGVWADEPFTPKSEARQGQTQFECGGLLDDKSFFATHERIIDMAHDWCGGDPNESDFSFTEMIANMIEIIVAENH